VAATVSPRRAAFVIPHPYVDALACFREPIKRLADEGWLIDLFTTLSSQHCPPFFHRENVRVREIELTRAGAARLVGNLICNRPKFDWLFAVPQWSLHYASIASALAGIPMACISDELKAEAEATSADRARWKRRERRAHQRCAFTIAFSHERASFIRSENQLDSDHPIVIVPNSAPGPARRLVSRYYQDALAIPCDRPVLLHAGSWWWKLQFGEVEDVARLWSDPTVLVFQGRIQNHFPASAAHPNLRFSSTVLPSEFLDYAVSSAHVGLALYDTKIANDRLMGTASGKVMVYLKNQLPVIALKHPSFDWIGREGCGLCVDALSDIGAATGRICREYPRYAANVRRVYDEQLDFTRNFEPVMALMNGADHGR
jgi:hypothetical protein